MWSLNISTQHVKGSRFCNDFIVQMRTRFLDLVKIFGSKIILLTSEHVVQLSNTKSLKLVTVYYVGLTSLLLQSVSRRLQFCIAWIHKPLQYGWPRKTPLFWKLVKAQCIGFKIWVSWQHLATTCTTISLKLKSRGKGTSHIFIWTSVDFSPLIEKQGELVKVKK